MNTDEIFVPIAALNNYDYCPRCCWYIHVAGEWIDNEYTIAGTRQHQRVDGGEFSSETEVKQWRGMPLHTHHLGLIGKADLVEELPEPNPNALLRSRQYKASFDLEQTLAIARQFVQGKLFNQHTILARFSRQDKRSEKMEAALKSLKCCQKQIGTADSLNSIRGYEGQGAASYFGVLGELLAQTPWDFSKRD